jgi:signal transduction histidine kinase/CheY-like chemotaxis protein
MSSHLFIDTSFLLPFFRAKALLHVGLLLFFPFLSQSLFSQQQKITIENVTFPDGTQLAYALEIAQDSTGLIWFHANQEFYTYDGQELSKLAPEAVGFPISMPPHFYMNKATPYYYIVQDSLLIYDPAARKVVQAFQPKNILKPHKRVRISYPTKGADGTIWALAISGVNFQYAEVVRSANGSAFQTVSPMDVNWYYEATLVKGDQFFVKLRDRVEAFDSTGRVKVYPFPEGADPSMPSMVMDAENTIWVIHSPDKTKDQYAVYYLKEGQEEFIRLPVDKRFPQEEQFGKLFADGHFIWHWGTPFHLSRIRLPAGQTGMADAVVEDFTDKVIEQRLHFPFFNSSPLMLFRDQSGVIWMTTRAGIIKMVIEEDLFRNYALQDTDLDGVDENTRIKGIAEGPEGNIYLSHNKGVAILNPATGNLTALSLNLPPQTQKTHALTYAQGFLFWNEYVIDPKTGTSRKLISLPTYDYLTHELDPAGKRLWIGVNAWPFQLNVYDIEKGEITEINLPEKALPLMNNEIRQIHHSPSTGTLFLAVWLGGVLELDLEGRILHQYDDNKVEMDEKWHGNVMYGLYEDAEGQLWVAHGLDAGLSKIDLKTRKITEYPYQVNSFTGTLKRVFQILPEGEDKLWLVTEKGTLRLDKKTGNLIRYPMCPTLSEMAYHRLPGFATSDGTFYVGTPNGTLSAFDPAILHEGAGFDQIFRVAITRYARFSEKRDSLFVQQTGLVNLQEIRLTHRDRFFNLEFFIPDFRNTGQNLYSYWLEGYDKDWSTPARINWLQYENLPPGEYTLHIRGGLNPEYYESSERMLKVIVARAWYKTWWAFLLYAGAVLVVFIFFYRQRLKRELEKAEGHRLRELNTLKSRLYTNITHEFRTPLTVIMGMADNIQGYDQERKLIRRNSNNLLRLINQLLDLSKLDSGALNLDLVQGDIINYLQYLTESFYSMAREKEVRLTFYSEIPELVMDFDEGKIQHIVYNLLSNALKFTESGGRVVLHANEGVRKAGRYLQLKVQDTGVGIPSEQLPHIFDRFFQADSSTTRRGEGTGIGLALTKELIELMGGSIEVESALEKGTTFTLLLPFRLEVQTSAMLGLPSSGMPASEPASDFPKVNTTGDKPLLLLIEDNADVVTYIAGLLERDYEIHLAPNGLAGIDKAFELVPDIIISDVMMPEKDGYEVCETLKEDERTSHIPIILLTAKATTEDRIEGLKGGADAYLVKPFHKEELFVRLEQLVALRKALQARYAGYALLSERAPLLKEPTLDDLFLQKLVAFVQENLDKDDLGVPQLCRAVQRSNTQVNRKLKALLNKTPSQFIRSIRLQKARELLKSTDLTVSEIAYKVGFNDPNYFSRLYSEEFGHPPTFARK